MPLLAAVTNDLIEQKKQGKQLVRQIVPHISSVFFFAVWQKMYEM